MRVTDSKTARKALQQLLDERRRSRAERVVIDFYEWKKKREARRAMRVAQRLAQYTGPGEESRVPDCDE